MSRKAHPIGFRLGTTQFWKVPVNPFDFYNQQKWLGQLHEWFLRFCHQNKVYVFLFALLGETPSFLYFHLIFYFGLRSIAARRRLRGYFRGKLWKPQKIKEGRMPRVSLGKRVLFQRYQTLLLLYVLTMSRHARSLSGKIRKKDVVPSVLLPYSSFISHYRHVYGRVPQQRALLHQRRRKVRFLKGGNLRKNISRTRRSQGVIFRSDLGRLLLKRRNHRYGLWRRALAVFKKRFRLLRLKRFFEVTLRTFVRRYIVIFLQNLSLTLAVLPRRLVGKTPNKIKFSRQRRYGPLVKADHVLLQALETQFRGLSFRFQLARLLLLAGWYVTPGVLLQWLSYTLAGIRKHSLTLSQKKAVLLFCAGLEQLVYRLGILKGYRLDLQGKFNGKERTLKVRYGNGRIPERQTLASSFNYTGIDVPTYAGAISLRLWLMV